MVACSAPFDAVSLESGDMPSYLRVQPTPGDVFRGTVVLVMRRPDAYVALAILARRLLDRGEQNGWTASNCSSDGPDY